MPLRLGTRLGCGFKACAAVLYYQWRLIKAADMDKFWLWPWEQANAEKSMCDNGGTLRGAGKSGPRTDNEAEVSTEV